MPNTDEKEPPMRLATGVAGLDEILNGGLVPGRAYLVRGGPGSGKTILGLHFLTEGAANDERCLFITLEETEQQIRQNARSVGLDLTGIMFLDLSPPADFFTQTQSYDLFAPAEVDREPTTQKIVEKIEELQPQRIYLEAMTQFRYLTPDSFQFHKQVLSFLRFLMHKGATVLFSSEGSATAPDDDLQFVSDGVIQLDRTQAGRSVTVLKLRGSIPIEHTLARRGALKLWELLKQDEPVRALGALSGPQLLVAELATMHLDLAALARNYISP